MTQITSIGLLLMPSSQEPAWRSAISLAARERGWTVTKARGAEAESTPSPKVVLVTDFQAIALDAVDAWAIVGGSLEEALMSALDRRPDPLEAQRFASVRLATASALIESGAILLDQMAAELEFPGLGSVSVGSVSMPNIDDAVVSDMIPPLAFYKALPAVRDARVIWPTSVFNYSLRREATGGTPDIDLTGGARVLMHGPSFALPPGWWRIIVRFSIDPDESAHLLFEWGAGEDTTIYSQVFEIGGFYELVLDHQWKEPAPAELRILAERAHFMGRLVVQDCVVEMLPDITDVYPG